MPTGAKPVRRRCAPYGAGMARLTDLLVEACRPLALSDPQLLAVGSPAEAAITELLANAAAVDDVIEHDAGQRAVVAGWAQTVLVGRVRAALGCADVAGCVQQAADELYRHGRELGLIVEPGDGVGAIIIRDGRLLLGLRQGAHGSGTWCLPGGHVEPGEAISSAAARETLEETGLRIRLRDDPVDGVYMYVPEKRRLYRDHFVVADADGPARVMEPDKCAGWRDWPLNNLPANLFGPLAEALRRGLDLHRFARLAVAG